MYTYETPDILSLGGGQKISLREKQADDRKHCLKFVKELGVTEGPERDKHGKLIKQKVCEYEVVTPFKMKAGEIIYNTPEGTDNEAMELLKLELEDSARAIVNLERENAELKAKVEELNSEKKSKSKK